MASIKFSIVGPLLDINEVVIDFNLHTHQPL